MEEGGKTVNLTEEIIRRKVDELRPPIELRDQLDFQFEFKNNTLEISSIRPRFMKKDEIIKSPVAKTKYTKSSNEWSIYWMRASGKWELYKPMPKVANISEFFIILKEDKHGCFFG